ncbi:hypothetical protein G6F56_002295 [Rhizopus delemar]|uniref:Rho GTPase-activating protein n=1 Tax=Rhizopus stolonifer TaxID=4846 RepID=A0A367KQ91_RHIST|nr:hypothetical protein G6F56_002295 [Rhizopus delemar]RCI04366.1 hypothetical protein CU098_002941 [Rhizopus stolonifer]
MKSRKLKNAGPPSPSGEHPRSSNAFNFIKNRLFQNNITQNEKNITLDGDKIIKPTSRSFDELPVNTTQQKLKSQRPMSMMAMESLLARSNNLIPNRRNKDDRAEKRASLIVVREGYLFKKMDFRPFQKQSKLDRGWKLYKVILRGHKLYLFKVHAESPLRSLFPSSSPSLSISSSIDNNLSTTSLKLSLSEFDAEAQQVFNAHLGLIFIELHTSTMQPKRQVHLVLDSSYLYICQRLDTKQAWKIEQKISIQQLKMSQINHPESTDPPTSPSSSTSSESSLNQITFTLSICHPPSVIGVYTTQHRHAGHSWIQAFQNVYQKKPMVIDEDLFSSLSTMSLDGPASSVQPSVASTVLDLDTKMYDVKQRYHPDLIRTCRADEIDIVGGSVTALIHELLMTQDKEYTHIFLLNYSTFTTGSFVLNEIKSFVLDFASQLDDRVIELFVLWCKEFRIDVMSDVASGMISVLESIQVDTTQVKRLVLDTVTENAKQAAGNEIVYQNEKTESFEGVDLSHLITNQLTPSLFLNLSPACFADQVRLFHFSQHSKHRQALMHPLSYLPRPQTSADMLNALLFTSTSPHFLTKLIRNHVLIDSQQQSDGVLLRARLLTHWIRVGIRLFELKDISGWCAVAMGICSAGVVRLREAWKLVDREMVQLVQTEWAHTLTEHGLFDQTIWSDTWESETCQRHAKVLGDSQSLPFFGTLRQTVDRLRKHPSKFLGPKVVSFEECKHVYKIVRQSLDSWIPMANNNLPPCNTAPIRPLQQFFEHSATDLASVPHNLKYLQESSLACEPKIFGQIFESHRLNSNELMTDVLPPSNSSLQFPMVLESCLLFENGLGFFHEGKGVENETSLDEGSRKGFRRRTFNLDLTMASTGRHDILESIHSRSWFGSISSGRQNSLRHNENNMQINPSELDLVVSQGDIIFKASAILRGNEKNEGIKRTESLHSVHFLKQEEDTGKPNQPELLVTVKGAYFDCLVECLISNISSYQEFLKDQWYALSLTEEVQEKIDRVVMDEENFINIFFIAYRSHYSSTHLLNLFHKKYLNAKTKCKLTAKRKNPTLKLVETYFNQEEPSEIILDQEEIKVTSYDWKQTATIHLRILNLVLFWVEEYPYDFIDEPEFIGRTHTFLGDAKENLEDWRTLLEGYLKKTQEENNLAEALELATKIQEIIGKLESKFIQNSLSPCYDMKSTLFDTECLLSAHDLYQQLMHGSQLYTATLTETDKRMSFSISHEPLEQDIKSPIDDCSAEYLLEQVDKNVRQLLECINIQDWAQTFDVMEAQCGDLYAWLPARKPSCTSKISTAFASVMGVPSSHNSDYHVLPEDVVVSDIFNAIQGARRSVVSPSAFSDDDLLLAFPGSIQHLYCLHYIIRSWAIQEISCVKLDAKTRISRIQKFIQIILLSKNRQEKMNLFPELKGSESKKSVPGFVENAIASALVSPEVRLFSKAWSEIATRYGAELDSLDSLLNKMQTPSGSEKDFLVPSLGWILERVVEICFTVPDTAEKKDNWMNFDKKRYLYHFLELVINVQADISEQEQQDPGLSFLISPNPTKMNWEGMKEWAARENKKGVSQGASISMLGASSRSQNSKTVFNKLVIKQLEKLKKDFKERDRVDKDWLTLQYKMQKKQMEQAKSFEKQDRPQSVMPRINSFFKGLRPVSMVASPLQIFPANNSEDQLAATKASTVINLIHSTTSIASTYNQRDFVFRIVTEEGGQYLFQGMDRQDLDDWMRQINDAAREGAAKRQSVLAAESLDNECEQRKSVILTETPRPQSVSHRKSVYGVSLDFLMRERRVPAVVEKCIQEIEKRGLEEVGIYRVAGTGSIVTALKTEFNKDISKVDLSDPRWADINVIADAFKQFLRELPEPLLTYTFYEEFINASASGDHDQRVYLIKEVIKKLPYSNYTLLKRIIEHFVTVTDFEAINHMYATNLAIVFGPTLLQPAPGPASFATTMSNLGHHQNIVKYLVLNYHYLFDIESEQVEQKNAQSLE